MKKIYALFLAFSLFIAAANAQYSKQNINMLGHWWNPSQPAEPTYGIKYNSVYGWVDPQDNKEYAIIGSSSGTNIIDVTDPANPVLSDYVPGARSNCIWREYQTYGKYLYAVSDDAPPNSFQIMDLSYLPDSVHVIYDSTDIFEQSHTIFIDGNKLYCGSVTYHGTGGHFSMIVYSLANPEVPTLLRKLNSDVPSSVINHVHDMMVRNDTVYASCGYDGFYIFTFDTVSNTFTTLNSLTSYPDQGYNHSSAMTPDGHTLVFADEVPANKALKIIDISDIFNISVESTFKSHPGATPHNPYIKGKGNLILAYYQDGIQIYDITDPTAPVKTGYFDTDTLHGLNDNYPTSSTYHGAWGAYVNLPSGVLLSSDMQNGLFVLDASAALVAGVNESAKNENSIDIFPNPTSGDIAIKLNLKEAEQLQISVVDLTGRVLLSIDQNVSSGTTIKKIETSELASGVYFLRLKGKNVLKSQKIIKD